MNLQKRLLAQRVMEARVGAGVDYIAGSEAIQAAYQERGIRKLSLSSS